MRNAKIIYIRKQTGSKASQTTSKTSDAGKTDSLAKTGARYRGSCSASDPARGWRTDTRRAALDILSALKHWASPPKKGEKMQSPAKLKAFWRVECKNMGYAYIWNRHQFWFCSAHWELKQAHTCFKWFLLIAPTVVWIKKQSGFLLYCKCPHK